MSLDSRVYVVSRSQGEYSDRTETPVVAFVQRESAERFIEDASAQAREAEQRFPIDYTTHDGEEMLENRRKVMTLDPDGADEYDHPHYFFCEVRLFTSLASAGEAGTAETTKIGSVHEHATGSEADGDAHTSPSSPNINKEGE